MVLVTVPFSILKYSKNAADLPVYALSASPHKDPVFFVATIVPSVTPDGNATEY